MKALFSAPSGQTIEYAVPLTAASNRDGGGSWGDVLGVLVGSGFVQWQGSSWRGLRLTFSGRPTKLSLSVINSAWTRPINFTMGGVRIADIRGMTEIDVLGDSNHAVFQSDASSGWFRFNDIKGGGFA